MTTVKATVHAANAYRQIITNFSNPLEFGEAISNSIDAAATNVNITIEEVPGPTGQPEIRIIIWDDGKGMNERTLGRFFNLGDSEKCDLKNDGDAESAMGLLIGEKGFGTKIYLNSRRVEVLTTDKKSGVSLHAVSQATGQRLRVSEVPRLLQLPSDTVVG